MLEIVRNRSWSVAHTVLDSEDGELADLSHLTTFRCQIREKIAVKDHKGFFKHPLVANVTVLVEDSILTLKLSRYQTGFMKNGEYLIDVVAFDDDGNDESLLDPEPVRVVTRPSSVVAGDVLPPEIPVVPPDFTDDVDNALQ